MTTPPTLTDLAEAATLLREHVKTHTVEALDYERVVQLASVVRWLDYAADELNELVTADAEAAA